MDNNIESNGKEHILASEAGLKRSNMMPGIISHGKFSQLPSLSSSIELSFEVGRPEK